MGGEICILSAGGKRPPGLELLRCPGKHKENAGTMPGGTTPMTYTGDAQGRHLCWRGGCLPVLLLSEVTHFRVGSEPPSTSLNVFSPHLKVNADEPDSTDSRVRADGPRAWWLSSWETRGQWPGFLSLQPDARPKCAEEDAVALATPTHRLFRWHIFCSVDKHLSL